MTTQELQEAEDLDLDQDNDAPDDFDGYEGGDGDDDEVQVGWLLVLEEENEQIVIPHPEDKKHAEVIEAFSTARKKKHDVMVLGRAAFDPMAVTFFGWSEDVQFPAMDKFEGFNERLEALMQATTELSANQVALQQAQAMLLEDEFEEAAAEAVEQAQAAAAKRAPRAPARTLPGPAPAKPKKGGFKPPTA